MRHDIIRPLLGSLTQDLSPDHGISSEDFENARRATAHAIYSGQPSNSFGTVSVEPNTTFHDDGSLNTLLAELDTTSPQPHRVLRRYFATSRSLDPRVGITTGAGQVPAKSYGPFIDAAGRSLAVDVFLPIKLISLQRVGATQPFLYITAQTLSGNATSIPLLHGSVWFAAPVLASNAPASSFVGLRIQSGTITFSSSIPVGTSPIMVPTAATVVVTLKLKPEDIDTTPGVPDASVATPSDVTFTFTQAGGTLTAAERTYLTAFATTLKLTWLAVPAQYEALLGRLIFPFDPRPASLSVSQSHTQLAIFSGQAPVSGGAWSLPVTITTPDTLGDAVGAGGMEVSLDAGLQVLPYGRDTKIDCGPCVLLVEPNALTISGKAARAPNIPETITLWQNSSLVLRTPDATYFKYIAQSNYRETWSIQGALVATLDQPRAVDNSRLRFVGIGLIEFLKNGSTITCMVLSNTSIDSTQSYALKNLLLNVTGPTQLEVTGIISEGVIPKGIALLKASLYFALPILPDPYATDTDFELPSESLGAMQIKLSWQSNAPVDIDIVLPQHILRSSPNASASGNTGVPKADPSLLDVLDSQSTAAGSGGLPGLTLLDLSTNVSQFGVSFKSSLHSSQGSSQGVSDLFFQVPVSNCRIITMPAVQWEPVVTPDQSMPFPSPITFPDCGAATQIMSDSVTLTPFAPRQAIDQVLADYHASPPSVVVARFTLPFGIVASARLSRSEIITPLPGLRQVQPTFTSANLKGGDQVSITAASRIFPGPQMSPSLPGSMQQLSNARSGGVPISQTVLTPIDINPTFGPNAPSRHVPVTRVDISGFGESIFSDWRNPSADAATISKVVFNVIVGRTLKEVVQISTILYPYAVRVVRTITIERQNTAAIDRHDSGWQAVSDGSYAYPHPGLVTHPGVIKGVVNVTNIRDLNQTHDTPDGSQLMAVQFDCSVQMENVVVGQGPNGVPARNQIGYVQMTDKSGPPPLGQLKADQYAALLASVGPMGGPIDCTINIGETGLLMRVTHINIYSTNTASDPQFAMAAWGSPVLPAGGQWSWVGFAPSDLAPRAVDSDMGVPLIRSGPSTALAPATSPYRFAHPSDLLNLTPSISYGILHSTGTQRLLFLQPKIETTTPFALTSTVKPLLADIFGLGTSTGPFPRPAACIPFNDADYQLLVRAGGNLTLQLPSPSFTTPVIKRVLRESQTVRTIVYTADELGVPSVVTVLIDTTAAKAWSVTLTNLSHATESGSLGEAIRVVGTFFSDSTGLPSFGNTRLVFGNPLKLVASLVAFLEKFGLLPPLKVSVTSDWAVIVTDKIDFKELISEFPELEPFMTKFIVDFNAETLMSISPDTSRFTFQLDLTIKLPTGFSVVAIGVAGVLFDMSETGSTFGLTIGAGIGVGFSIGSFDALAYYVQTQSLVVGDKEFSVTATSLIKGSVDLKVVDVELSVEAKIELLKVMCGGGSSIWGIAQLTIALEVSIFWVIDIEVHYQTEVTGNLDNGPCILPP